MMALSPPCPLPGPRGQWRVSVYPWSRVGSWGHQVPPFVTPSTPWSGPCQGGGRQRPTSRSVSEATCPGPAPLRPGVVPQPQIPVPRVGPGLRLLPVIRGLRWRGRALRHRKCWWVRRGMALGGWSPGGASPAFLEPSSRPPFPPMAGRGLRALQDGRCPLGASRTPDVWERLGEGS